MHLVKKIILIAVSGACLAGCSEGHEKTSPVLHNVFTVNPISIGAEKTLSLPAVVEEARSIAVGFKTAGQIQRICVKEGQHVSQGQVLAMLDTVDYSIGISTLRERYRQMVVENERRARLHATGNMSDNDYENAVSGLRQLALQLQLEENKLSYCTLKAPASGIITKINFESSEMVDAGTPVIELMDNNHIEAVVDLPVRYFTERERFVSFSGKSTAIPNQEVELKMLSIIPRTDNSQLYRMRLTPSSAINSLTPGMNMTVKIQCQGRDEAGVRVPLSAVFDREGTPSVWVVNPADSVITSRAVDVIGYPKGEYVEVTGLTEDDILVRAGVHHLIEGEKVKIITESETNPGNLI